MRVLLALTVGLLAFLAVDGALEGLELAGEWAGPSAAPSSSSSAPGSRSSRSPASTATWRAAASARRPPGARGSHLALMVAIGIGLHNLGEGLAIGSAYAVGELALGAFLVVGFAIHNTTEGLAIVAPLIRERPTPSRLLGARPDRRRAGDPRRAGSARRSTTPSSRRSCSASGSARSSR